MPLLAGVPVLTSDWPSGEGRLLLCRIVALRQGHKMAVVRSWIRRSAVIGLSLSAVDGALVPTASLPGLFSQASSFGAWANTTQVHELSQMCCLCCGGSFLTPVV